MHLNVVDNNRDGYHSYFLIVSRRTSTVIILTQYRAGYRVEASTLRHADVGSTGTYLDVQSIMHIMYMHAPIC